MATRKLHRYSTSSRPIQKVERKVSMINCLKPTDPRAKLTDGRARPTDSRPVTPLSALTPGFVILTFNLRFRINMIQGTTPVGTPMFTPEQPLKYKYGTPCDHKIVKDLINACGTSQSLMPVFM